MKGETPAPEIRGTLVKFTTEGWVVVARDPEPPDTSDRRSCSPEERVALIRPFFPMAPMELP